MAATALRIGTRGSPLALFQAEAVRDRLIAARPELDGAVELQIIKTTGDIVRDRALADIGGKGLFAKEIEEALLDRRIDLAVHSLKDLPTWLPSGLTIAATLPREDPREVLLVDRRRLANVTRLADLPAGIRVGTSSPRRQAQVLAMRRDLAIVGARGNVDTRIRLIEEGAYDATILAYAGFRRLRIEDRIDAVLGVEEMLPAAAQGVIAVECRASDTRVMDLLLDIDDQPTHTLARAERSMLAILDGSCRTPIGALARVTAGNGLSLDGLIALPDGSAMERTSHAGAVGDPVALGEAVGHELRGRANPAYFA
jgi:hydroxymethylbilane synthase